MTRVDFYVLDEQARGDKFLLACKLAEKAVGQGRRIYIHTAGAEPSRRLDDLLWTFNEESFIPHGLAEDEAGADEDTPVHIGHGQVPDNHEDVLINLADEVPLFFSRFQRVAEVIDRQGREAGRERFRFYRDRGYELNTHNINL